MLMIEYGLIILIKHHMYPSSSPRAHVEKTLVTSDKALVPPKDKQFTSGNAPLAVQNVFPLIQTKTTKECGNGSVLTAMSYSNLPISAERSTLQYRNCASVNENGICREDAGCSGSGCVSASFPNSPRAPPASPGLTGELGHAMRDRASSSVSQNNEMLSMLGDSAWGQSMRRSVTQRRRASGRRPSGS